MRKKGDHLLIDNVHFLQVESDLSGFRLQKGPEISHLIAAESPAEGKSNPGDVFGYCLNLPHRIGAQFAPKEARGIRLGASLSAK